MNLYSTMQNRLHDMYRSVYLGICLILLVSCISSNSEIQTQDAAPTEATQVMQATSTPLIIPSATILPSPAAAETVDPDQLAPLPQELFGLHFDLQTVIFDNTEYCALPCFLGIQPGKTEPEHAEILSETALNTAGQNNDFEIIELDEREIRHIRLIEDFSGQAFGHVWDFEPYGSITYSYVIDSNVEALSGIIFSWFTNDTSMFQIEMSPEILISKLGPPDQMYAQIQQSEVSTYGLVSYLLVYEQGIILDYAVRPIIYESETSTQAELCLNSSKSSENWGILSFTTPFNDNGELNSIHRNHIKRNIEFYSMKPIVEYGYSIQELSDLVTNDESCIWVDITDR